MNQIQQLINQMCPNGVEWKTLGEVCEIVRGASPRPIGAYLTTAADGIPWIKIGDVNPNSRFIESTVEKITAEGAAHSRLLHKGDFVLSNSMSFGRPYILKIDGCIHDGWVSISKFDKHLISEYLFYILKSDVVQYHWRQKAGKGSVANLNADIIKATPIPLPPLAIQTCIVEILDHFTNLNDNLNAELNLRRKQFEHYREKLLAFGEDVEWKKLGEVCDTLSGFPFDSSKFVDKGIKLMRGMNVKRGRFDFNKEDDRYWTDSKGLEKYLLEKNDIIISMDGSLVGKSFGLLLEEHLPLLLVQRVARVRAKKVDSHYVYHIIRMSFADYVDNKKTAGAIPHISMKDINNFPIPIPPLATQQSIVSTLDKFTALIENIEKELALRQKQYEYYREQLLSFERSTL